MWLRGCSSLFRSGGGGSQRRARQHRSWRTLTSVRVLPSCVSRKQHVVYKTSHANVVLFTSCFGFVFLISRARNLQLWPCNIFQYQKTLCLISCLCVFKLLSLCARVCARACVLGWGKGWSLLAGLLDRIPQTGLPPSPTPTAATTALWQTWFWSLLYLLSPPVTYLVLK